MLIETDFISNCSLKQPSILVLGRCRYRFLLFFSVFLKSVRYSVPVFQNTAILVSVFGIFPCLHYFKSVRSLYVHGIGLGSNCRTSAMCTLLYNVHCKVAGIMQERESK